MIEEPELICFVAVRRSTWWELDSDVATFTSENYGNMQIPHKIFVEIKTPDFFVLDVNIYFANPF
jgi:hypothetical protein